MTSEQLSKWLASGPPRLLDGATGSALLRRGVASASRLWGVGALLDTPDQVRMLHRDYALAGAEALTACTFRVAPFSLRRENLEKRAAELARRAVRLARDGAEEAGRTCLVLASQTTLEDCYRPDLVPDDRTLSTEHLATAEILAEAGADAILLETFNTVREAHIAAAAAVSTGLPVIVSFVCRLRSQLLSAEDPTEAATAVSLPGVVAVGVNCTTINDVPSALRRLAAGTPLPLAAYANNAWFAPDSDFLRAAPLEPASYADHAAEWAELGARLVGGCCGTGPEHVAAVRTALTGSGLGGRRSALP
jgi:S-methylmethionine-dependent homocysteine/selenocysteine methylase